MAEEIEDQTFNEAFHANPLREQYRKFGEVAKETIDPAHSTAKYIEIGSMGADLMAAEHAADPDHYDRGGAILNLETALRVSGVPMGDTLQSQELVSMFWVAKLDCSTPGGENEPRSFAPGIPPEWFGGNISRGVVRILAKCISRASGKRELDVWEYKPGMESLSRDMIARLRRGELSVLQVDKLIRDKRAALDADKAPKKSKALTDLAISKRKEAEVQELNTLTDAMAEYAFGKLGKDQDDVRKYLESRNIISQGVPREIEDVAAEMTPSQARELVTALINGLEADKSRGKVIAALMEELATARDQVANMRKPGLKEVA